LAGRGQATVNRRRPLGRLIRLSNSTPVLTKPLL